jgi:ketosteroid isomerase-like protein
VEVGSVGARDGPTLTNVPETASPQVFERFKQGWECWNDGELDLMEAMYAEDGELDMSAVFTGMPRFRGRESMRRQWEELWETWEGLRMDPLEVFDIGGGRFVVDMRLWGRGKRSGVEVDQRCAFLYTVRAADEKVVRCQLFPSVEVATESATASKSDISDR